MSRKPSPQSDLFRATASVKRGETIAEALHREAARPTHEPPQDNDMRAYAERVLAEKGWRVSRKGKNDGD